MFPTGMLSPKDNKNINHTENVLTITIKNIKAVMNKIIKRDSQKKALFLYVSETLNAELHNALILKGADHSFPENSQHYHSMILLTEFTFAILPPPSCLPY